MEKLFFRGTSDSSSYCQASIILKQFKFMMELYPLMTAFSDGRKVLISRQVKYRGVSEMKILGTWMLLKNNGGWLIFFIVWLKMTSRTCLLISGLKFIFHWKAKSLILAQSLFSLFADVFMWCVMENKYMSSENSL